MAEPPQPSPLGDCTNRAQTDECTNGVKRSRESADTDRAMNPDPARRLDMADADQKNEPAVMEKDKADDTAAKESANGIKRMREDERPWRHVR